jgi:DNA-binding transcriptional ArsR family regulator
MPVDSLIPAEFDGDNDRSPNVITLRDEAVIKAISSETAQCVLTALQDSPLPVSKIADELDASIQVVSYHIDRLESAGLVTTVATTYSIKGTQMDIYAPATSELVIKFDSCTERE